MAARKRSRRQKSQVEIPTGRPSSALFGYRYPLIVAAIAAPLFALYFYPYAENGPIAAGIQSYLAGYARMAGVVIRLFDARVGVSDGLIAGSTFSMRIVKTCDAMEVNILLAAALAGFPMRIRRRLVAIVLAVLSLILANVLRLCLLFWLGAHAPSWFNRTHETLAPLLMVICALVIFLIAIPRTEQESQAGSAETATAP